MKPRAHLNHYRSAMAKVWAYGVCVVGETDAPMPVIVEVSPGGSMGGAATWYLTSA